MINCPNCKTNHNTEPEICTECNFPFNATDKEKAIFIGQQIMKKSSILINVSRGGIVNEKDLDFALNNKLIFFAGIDVFEKEPPDISNPLLSNKRVLLSPHAATFTKECLENMSIETVTNIIDFFEKRIDKSKIVNL